MELKRSFRSGYYLMCLVTICICFVLGFILVVSIDKIPKPTIEQLLYSIYTVYTQFGMLVFSVLVIYQMSVDYKEKNILFYKLCGYNWLKYFLNKLGIALLWLSVATIISILVVSIIYGDFSYSLSMIFYFESVLIYEVLVTSLWGFLFKNLILGFVVNLFFWLVSIVASTGNKLFALLSYYDASNDVYQQVGQYFDTKGDASLPIVENCIYLLSAFIIILILVGIFRKRWERNGI